MLPSLWRWTAWASSQVGGSFLYLLCLYQPVKCVCNSYVEKSWGVAPFNKHKPTTIHVITWMRKLLLGLAQPEPHLPADSWFLQGIRACIS